MKMFLAALAAGCAFCFAAQIEAQTPAASPPPLLGEGSSTESIQFADGRTLPIRSKNGRFLQNVNGGE